MPRRIVWERSKSPRSSDAEDSPVEDCPRVQASSPTVTAKEPFSSAGRRAIRGASPNQRLPGLKQSRQAHLVKHSVYSRPSPLAPSPKPQQTFAPVPCRTGQGNIELEKASFPSVMSKQAWIFEKLSFLMSIRYSTKLSIQYTISIPARRRSTARRSSNPRYFSPVCG